VALLGVTRAPENTKQDDDPSDVLAEPVQVVQEAEPSFEEYVPAGQSEQLFLTRSNEPYVPLGHLYGHPVPGAVPYKPLEQV